MNGLTENTYDQARAIKRFLRDYLDKPKDEQRLQSILADIGGYYDADRAYVFELNAERTHASNTCEWCREGMISSSTWTCW